VCTRASCSSWLNYYESCSNVGFTDRSFTVGFRSLVLRDVYPMTMPPGWPPTEVRNYTVMSTFIVDSKATWPRLRTNQSSCPCVAGWVVQGSLQSVVIIEACAKARARYQTAVAIQLFRSSSPNNAIRLSRNKRVCMCFCNLKTDVRHARKCTHVSFPPSLSFGVLVLVGSVRLSRLCCCPALPFMIGCLAHYLQINAHA
jgi:hypothetical protein